MQREEKMLSNNSQAAPFSWSGILKGVRICMVTAAIGALLFTTTSLPDLWEIAPIWLIGGFIVGMLILGVVLYFIFAPGPGSSGRSAFDIETNAATITGAIALVILGVFWAVRLPGLPSILATGVLLTFFCFYMFRMIKVNVTMEQENEEVRRQYGELLKIDREKTDFINVTSHQLRTPLTEISWGLGTLAANQSLDPVARDVLARSLDGIKRLIVIIDEMFRARIIENQSATITASALVDLVKLVGEILEKLQQLAMERQTTVTFTQPEKDISIHADREKMAIAISSVIENAIRYAPKKTVAVSVSTESGKAVVRIADTGIGIAPEDQTRVFTRFYRGKNALLVQPDGSGIGLYNARVIIQQHDGEITFVSTIEQGTVFIIRLPLA